MTNLATPWKRVLALAIDNLIFLILEMWIFAQVAKSSDIAGILNNLLYLILVMMFGMVIFGLINIFFTSMLGGSIGKLLTGISVVNSENNKISFWKAMLRNYVGYFVSGVLVWLGFIWAFKDPEHRAWHDMIADTYVVNKNSFGVVTGLITAILLAGACGYLIMGIVGQIGLHMPIYKNIVDDIVTELKPTPTPTPTSAARETWKTYTAKSQLFTMQYPSDWIATDSTLYTNIKPTFSMTDIAQYKISIEIINQTIDSWKNEQGDIHDWKFTPLIVNGNKAQSTYDEPYEESSYTVMIEHQDSTVSFSLYPYYKNEPDQETLDLFNRVVSTVKFAD